MTDTKEPSTSTTTTTTSSQTSSTATTTATEEDLDYPPTQPASDSPDGWEDAEGEPEAGEPCPAAETYPSVACPCSCHENTAHREGRPWLAFSNAAYVVCPLCWIDAYMTAHGDEGRLFDCEIYLRGRGKDPKVPASRQC
ncbi:hypothetical protein F4804DRAFT_332529 [Jackrogersella minutella]|nr:hypothetical protein F4804DRAFT_332529 [Jackrogersella minutella]